MPPARRAGASPPPGEPAAPAPAAPAPVRVGVGVPPAAAAAADAPGPAAARPLAWQVYALLALALALVGLVMIARLGTGAAVAARYGWGAAASRGRLGGSVAPDVPDVIGPPYRARGGAGRGGAPGAAASASPPAPSSSAGGAPRAPGASSLDASPLVPTRWRVVATYPHDRGAFTQGLAWRGPFLLEGTGMRGASSLRAWRPAGRGAALQPAGPRVDLPASDFGEGVAVWPPTDERALAALPDAAAALAGATVFQLTWQERTVHAWAGEALLAGGPDARAGHATTRFSSTSNEGWGLAADARGLVMSDGSDVLHWWGVPGARGGGDVVETRRVRVVDAVRAALPAGVPPPTRPAGVARGAPVSRLNELELVHGWVLANVWYQPVVAIISPATGAVVYYLDLSELVAENAGGGADCLNGLAYTTALDAADGPPAAGRNATLAAGAWGGRLWLTGKYWPRMYEVELLGLVRADELSDGL